MAIYRLFIRPSEPCIFVIFRSMIIFKFWILIESYKRINDTFGFLDFLSKSSGFDPKFSFFQYIYSHFISSHLAIEFRVDSIICFDSLNHQKKIKRSKTQNDGKNHNGR
jgi:hypothetical protein